MKKANMRKYLALCLGLVIMLGCTVTAAADTAAWGLAELSITEGCSVQPMDINDKVIEATHGVYSGVEKLSLSFASEAGEQYAVFLLYGETVPTEGSVRYINQLPGTGEKLGITLYPDSLATAGSYYIYISHSGSYTQLASFTVAEPPYTIGDVDGSGEVNVGDATILLRYLAELTGESETVILPAADVDGSGQVDIGDATKLLRVLVELDTL